jgi:transcriptional regulator with XRE-family HTH domain
MTTILAQQISARMKAKNLSTITLERKAGLKQHAVRNILRGNSNRPAVDIVQGVAAVLGCTMEGLLQGQGMFKEDKKAPTRKKLLEHPYKAGLFMDTVKLIDGMVTKQKHPLTTEQILTCVEETFFHALQKGAKKVDQAFAEWFMGMVVA